MNDAITMARSLSSTQKRIDVLSELELARLALGSEDETG